MVLLRGRMNRPLLALLLAAAVPSLAQSAVESKGPSKEFETFMKSLEGSWKCETKRVAGAAGPDSAEQVVKSTIKISKDKDMGGM